MSDAYLYIAIGDVHGELEKLTALHQTIFRRIAAERTRARIIHLGDYVDRGPDSRGVIERLMELQARHPEGSDIEVHALMGNHEALMVEAYLEGREGLNETWFVNGGMQTLDSYAGRLVARPEGWRDLVPGAHIHWMRNLPTLIYDNQRSLAFVHAGIDPAKFPSCSDQIHLWTRSRKFFADADWPDRKALDGLMVVHGHTPTDGPAPEWSPRRVNIDTGAVYGGPLTAVVLKAGADPEFLQAA